MTAMAWRLFIVFLTIVQTIQAKQLGKPFSILNGLKPEFPKPNDISSVFYPVKNTKLFKNIQHKTVKNTETYFSEFLHLTYHPDDKDLIKTFFSIWQFEDETRDAAAFTYQPNLQNPKASHAKILGISPENMEGKSYVLARYWKKTSTKTITNVHLANLKPFPPNSTSDNITELFSEYGTHYLSGYEMGEMIYQVFVYDQDKTKDILTFPFKNPIYARGWRSHSFRQFTQPINQGSNGFCRESGKVLSASGDPDLENIRSELEDNIYKVSESIFMFGINHKALKLMEKLNKTTPLKLFFKPIIKKIFEHDISSPSKFKWNRVLSATIFQKYGAASLPNFPSVKGSGVEDYYDSFNPDLVTSTATNYVSINRMNFRLDDFLVLDPKYVTHLFIFADVLEITETAKVSLPGSQKIYLICREFVALSSGNNVPEIRVGSYGKTNPSIKIIAKRFRGILKVTQDNSGIHYTYANDLVYKTVQDQNLQELLTVKADKTKKLLYPDRQTVPELYDNIGKSHEANWLRRSLVNSLELAVTSVESIIAVQTDIKSVMTAHESLEWITTSLVVSSKNSLSLSGDLEMVLGRALLISKTKLTEYAKSKLLVPKLSFQQYKPLYQKLLSAVSTYEKTFTSVTREINRRKQFETITGSLKELNQNVKSIGSFLVSQAEVNAQYQDDISKTQQAIHNLEKDRISREQGKADKILKEIIKLQKDIKAKGNTLVAALKRKQKEVIVAIIFDAAQVIGSLFVGGVGLAHISAKLTGIVRVAKKVEHLVTIIEQVQKLYQAGINMRNDIGTINRALENIPSGQINVDNFPTELEWDDFDTDVTAYTGTGSLPSEVTGEGLDFQRVAKQLSARGRKYVSIAANVANMKYKQIQIEMTRDLGKRQSQRLRTLKTKFTQKELSDIDAKTTDLFELGNIIKMKENQVRSKLVQTFVVMDAALQYYYLQKGTVVKRYDTMAIQQAAVNQIQSSISALESFPSIPKDLRKPVEFNIPQVVVQDLLSDDGYKVNIPLSSSQFHEYVRVRILRMEVRADSISNSTDDTAYIQATASGESFQDRDLSRNPRTYSTFPTEYRTVYNIKSGETIGNPSKDFTEKFIKMTPFDDWVFRIPKVTTNKGIQFKEAFTTLRIKFYLRVIYNPNKLSYRPFYSRPSNDVLGSKDNLLTYMNGRSLVREWDAIMAINAKRVNDIWQKQYNDQTNAGFVKAIVTKKAVSFESRRSKFETRAILDVGPPKIQLIPNNQNRATLTIKIKSGLVEYWQTSKRSGKVIEHYNETLSTSDDTAVKGNMNLLKLRGSLTEKSTVVLDLSNGVFDVISMTLSKHVENTMRNEIQMFFTRKLKSKDFELAEITYERKITPPNLVPDKFYLKTGGFGTVSNPGLGTLYIFIKTHSIGSTAGEQSKRDFNDPLSIDKQIIPKGFEVALFINNRIIFNDIIKEEVHKALKLDVETKVLPGHSISASQQSLYVVGKKKSYHKIGMSLPFKRSRISPLYFTLRIPGRALKVKTIRKGHKIQVHWVNVNFDVSVPYPESYCPGSMGRCYEEKEHATITFSTSYVKTFKPTIDKDLTITYEEDTTASASSSSSGWEDFWYGYDFRVARNTVTSKANKYLKTELRFSFQSISAFALSQVLFPNQNVFNFKEVYIPGDMLILGDVVTEAT